MGDKISTEVGFAITITLLREANSKLEKLEKENAELKAEIEKLKDNFDEMNYARQVLKKLEVEK